MVRIGRLARRYLPQAQAEPLGPHLAADPGALGAKALPLAGFVEVGLLDIGGHMLDTSAGILPAF